MPENMAQGNSKNKIGFIFSTKDRVDFSLKCLPTIDSEKGFDLIWVDGSATKEGQELPDKYKFKNINLAGVFKNIGGGPDAAIQFGLKKLLDMGYDYCGLVENDILFKPGWFLGLINILKLAQKDGLSVGAATVRTYESRVLEYKENYALMWNIGAGMILFTREAARHILCNYSKLKNVNYDICYFFAKSFGVNLAKGIEPCQLPVGYLTSADFSYDMLLYKKGFVSIGTIPSWVEEELGVNVKKRGFAYVSKDKSGTGIAKPKVSKISLFFLFLTKSFWVSFAWIWKTKIGKFIEKEAKLYFRRRGGYYNPSSDNYNQSPYYFPKADTFAQKKN